jgi:hypothetical protein
VCELSPNVAAGGAAARSCIPPVWAALLAMLAGNAGGTLDAFSRSAMAVLAAAGVTASVPLISAPVDDLEVFGNASNLQVSDNAASCFCG